VRDVTSLEELAQAAAAGDAKAADAIVRALADDVYPLSLRMLWHPEDAEDATQEILVKVLTHLSTFRRESTLRTWVFRISANHLLSAKQSRLEQQQWSFDRLANDLSEGIGELVPAGMTSADRKAIVEEIKIGCTQAMLLCLDREQRLAYVLGDVFELVGEVAADILDIEPAAYRKRLQRAREQIQTFMRSTCGLLERACRCRCDRRVGVALRTRRVDPQRLLFTSSDILGGVREMEKLHNEAAQVFREQRLRPVRAELVDRVKAVVHGTRFPVVLD
jgi:RNA polymerase sigma factor (sigma-70 family)